MSGVGKLFVRRATFEKMSQPRAAHSHYKIGKCTFCEKKTHIHIKHSFCISHSGTFNAIYTVVVVVFIQQEHKRYTNKLQ